MEDADRAIASAANQLTSVQTPSQTVSFTYDGDGMRLSKTSASGTTYYMRDPQGRVLVEYTPTFINEYVYLDGQRLCKIWTDANNVKGRVYYHTDTLGTPLAETDESGQLISSAQYYPFGSEVRPGATMDPHKFTGKELDDEIGLYYFGARYYDAHMGRFISVDPVAGRNNDPLSWNRYAYGRDNPLRFLDPSGKVVVLTGSEKEQEKTLATIRNTVSANLRGFVRTTTGNQGQTIINTKSLRMRARAISGNFQALLSLASSDKVFGINTSVSAVATSEGVVTLGANSGMKGIFLDQGGLSLKENMSFVLVAADLTQREKAVSLAHEMRHAAFFALGQPFQHEMGLFEVSPGVFNAYNPNGPVNRATASAEIEAQVNFDPFYPQD